MKYDQEAHMAWGRAVCNILGIDPHTVLAGSIALRGTSTATWVTIDPDTGAQHAQRTEVTTGQREAIVALPSPWHPGPPKPEHRWVETSNTCDRDYHFQCTGCGATRTLPSDACREDG